MFDSHNVLTGAAIAVLVLIAAAVSPEPVREGATVPAGYGSSAPGWQGSRLLDEVGPAMVSR